MIFVIVINVTPNVTIMVFVYLLLYYGISDYGIYTRHLPFISLTALSMQDIFLEDADTSNFNDTD